MSEEETFKITDRRGRSESAPGAAPPSAAAGSGGGSADLTGLFVMFASAALIHLGAAPDPETGEHRADLGQAQAVIDMLRMLRDKTQGNRTEAESRLLEDTLYDLQMRFVRVARAQPGA